MIPPQAGAMMEGLGEGRDEARSILPSAFQPQGKAKADNPWQGTLDMYVDGLLGCADGIGKQGDKFRAQTEKLMKIAYELKKVNNSLTDAAQEGPENG